MFIIYKASTKVISSTSSHLSSHQTTTSASKLRPHLKPKLSSSSYLRFFETSENVGETSQIEVYTPQINFEHDKASDDLMKGRFVEYYQNLTTLSIEQANTLDINAQDKETFEKISKTATYYANHDEDLRVDSKGEL